MGTGVLVAIGVRVLVAVGGAGELVAVGSVGVLVAVGSVGVLVVVGGTGMLVAVGCAGASTAPGGADVMLGTAANGVVVAVGGMGVLVAVGGLGVSVAVAGTGVPVGVGGTGVTVAVGGAGTLVASGEGTDADGCGRCSTPTDAGVVVGTSVALSVEGNNVSRPNFANTTPPTKKASRARAMARPMAAGRRLNHPDADPSAGSERTRSRQPRGRRRVCTSTASCRSSARLNAGDGSTCWYDAFSSRSILSPI